MQLAGQDQDLAVRLSEGGTVTMPFEKAPWGDTFGTGVDRFGTRWRVSAAGQPG